MVDSLDMGGIQTFLLNVYKNIDRNTLQFDFLVFRTHEQVLEKEFLALGAKIYKLHNWRDGILRYKRELNRFFNDHTEYRVVHYHAGSLTDIEPLKVARKYGITVRVMHSHNTNVAGHFLTKQIYQCAHTYHKTIIEKYATDYFACGQMAGAWMFGSGNELSQKVIIINNGIKTDEYAFNPEIREKKRFELGVTDEFLIGHVARFSVEKNHLFLVDIMSDLVKKSNAVLICVGDGQEKNAVIKKAKECGVYDRIRFLGIRKDVKELLQAFDVFVLPSLSEGFPVTLVEAQAAGLPCVISDSISSEVAIKSNVQSLSLNAPLNEWSNAFLQCQGRVIENTSLINAGFDIQTTAKKLEVFYRDRV